MGVLFGFELVSDTGDIHGLAMGHMTVLMDHKYASSKDKNQSMMIFVAISDLLDCARQLASRGGRVTIVGTDSSFAIGFDCAQGKVTVSHHRSVLGEASCKDVVDAIWAETQRFVKEHESRFTRTDSTSAGVFDDLSLSMRTFAKEVLGEAEQRPRR